MVVENKYERFVHQLSLCPPKSKHDKENKEKHFILKLALDETCNLFDFILKKILKKRQHGFAYQV